MEVRVSRVVVPPGSTIGYGYGTDVESGRFIRFAGDWRAMSYLEGAVTDAMRVGRRWPVADVPEWAILTMAGGEEVVTEA